MARWGHKVEVKVSYPPKVNKLTGEEEGRRKVVHRHLLVTDLDDQIPSQPRSYRVVMMSRKVKLAGHTAANPKEELTHSFSISCKPKVRIQTGRLVTAADPAQYEEGEDWVKDGPTLDQAAFLQWMLRRFHAKAMDVIWELVFTQPTKRVRS